MANTKPLALVSGGLREVASTDTITLPTSVFSGEVDNGTSAATATIDWNAGQKQSLVLGANTTLSFTAPPGPGSFILRLVQDATGSRTVTWPANVKWPGKTAPTLTTAANSEDIISIYYNGMDYYAAAILDWG